MSSNWLNTTIGDILVLQRGFDLPSQSRREGLIPIMGSAGISGYHNCATAKGPGVVIGRSGVGSMGVVSYIDRDFWALNTTLFVKNFKGNNIRFIYYLLKTINFRQFDTGSAQSSLNRNIVYLHPIKIPASISEQREIAELLGALEDRINLLKETNSTLESIAQALFKSWFVDFDPVRAKVEGSVPLGMDEGTAALFPDGFDETPSGDVPRGWTERSFVEAVNVLGGGTPKTSNADYWGGDIPWFSVVDAPSKSDIFVIDTEKHITKAALEGSSTKLLPAGTTIISARGTVGRLALTAVPMAMNQSCYGLRGKFGDSYYTYFSTRQIVDSLKQRAHGSVFDTITRDTLQGITVVHPPEVVADCFDQTVSPIMEKIKNCLRQAQTLASLRDTLLPRLISGQIRLPQAHEEMEEALA